MITLKRNSLHDRFLSIIRTVWLLIAYFKKLKISDIIYIGSNCSIIIEGGSLVFKGRVHLSGFCELQVRNGTLIIGKNFCLNKYSRIISFKEIEIGDNVTIAQFVTILDHDHNYIYENSILNLEGYTSSAVKIGSNVWIGDKSTILKGVTIGSNVIIGTNTLVNKNVPSNCIIGGVPFKIIKYIE